MRWAVSRGRRGAAWLAGAALVAASLGSGCAVSHEPRLVALPAAGTRPVSRLEMIFDDRIAVTTIASILQRDLGLPEFPVTFEIYPHEGAFERALLDRGYDATLARSTSKTMTGVGGYRRVLLNGRRLAALEPAERVLLLAHELGHSLQYELGGGQRGTSDQWLREGFADWVAIRVLERLNVTTLAAMRKQREREVAAAGRARFVPFADLVTFPQWVRAGERGGTAPYAQAFLAADLLIERHGLATLLDYFRRFARVQDREGNFTAAFGEPPAGVEEALRARLFRR
ncbi:MAG TPA: hypothetical protein VM364_14915 [Vicinamibacterales bacterium]|nr:hypothetical protein [Vicinamibacterales bacterium]